MNHTVGRSFDRDHDEENKVQIQAMMGALRPVFANISEQLHPSLARIQTPPNYLSKFVSAMQISLPEPNPALVEVLKGLAHVQEEVMESLRTGIEPLAKGFGRTFLPPNLRDYLNEVSTAEVYNFVEKEAIPLYLIPRGKTAVRLIKAESREARRQILNSCFNSIIDDCEEVISSSESKQISDQKKLLLDGIGALRAGYTNSAQALFTVMLDTLITKLSTDKKTLRQIKNREKGASAPEEFDEMSIRESLVWLPIWNAHEKFQVQDRDSIPHHYSRHASVHAAGLRQFNKRNCIQALMLVTSLVGYADDLW